MPLASKRIAIILGHPDPDPGRFGRALADAYAHGARDGGHDIRTIDVASLEFPLLRTQDEWLNGKLPESLEDAQATIQWANHLVIFYPLWLGNMPARLKGFLEQVLRPGFALTYGGPAGLPKKLLTGKSARIVVTMGMPAFFYRWYFRAHSLKSLQRNILGFCGIRPIRSTLVGTIQGGGRVRHELFLQQIRLLGQRGI
ncbi:MAG TPA: NAD(P)H-dependent oxidoreductase [Gammaproteobacteria bacterium]|nr:NAD(P)H-dependent oxidoreductase [Gammaproteobacteria bacterium]